MTLSLVGFKNLIKSRTAAVLFVAVMLSPAFTFGQSGSRQNDNSNDEEPAAQSGGSTNSGPWGNSAGSTIGTREHNTEKPVTDPRLGPGGGTLGRPAGPTPDATGGPGGNPDVPFDTSMNLMFLAGGIVFAYLVYRRTFKLKAVTAENK